MFYSEEAQEGKRDYWRVMMRESSFANSWEISDQFGRKIRQLVKTYRLVEIFTF
jgi:hypothetical protein